MTHCDLALTYNSDIWAHEDSPDQVGCNQWLAYNIEQFRQTNILHVGTGTSSVYSLFGDKFARVDGITIMDSEIEVAKRIGIQHNTLYNIYKINKYDKNKIDQLPKDYSLLLDNNCSHYACCTKHWEEYFESISSMLLPGGIFLTHTQGMAPHTPRIHHLTIEELVRLGGNEFSLVCEKSLTNNYGHYPVAMVKKLN